jgi:acetyl-CoA carboxylase biotin carboxyl carrier protein
MGRETHEADVAFIKALAELLRANDLSELEVQREYGEDDSLTVRVAREMVVQMTAPAAQVPVAALPAAVAAAPAPVSADPADHPGAVASPMVGTVYLQSEPGSPPFVRLGDSVAEGQTLLIIEAMKTMNQIPAPRAGIVRRILVEDGSPVEYGAPLMIVE